MERKIGCLIAWLFVIALISSGVSWLILTASSSIITVPDDYETIQEAINAAQEGDTIFVRAGKYNVTDTIFVNKSLNLVGEDRENTIIDGMGYAVNIFHVEANYVNITGFTIQNMTAFDIFIMVRIGLGKSTGAISLFNSVGCVIKNITIRDCTLGVYVGMGSNHITISNITISQFGPGILIYNYYPGFPINGTTVVNNQIAAAFYGVMISGEATNNVIIGNNIDCWNGIELNSAYYKSIDNTIIVENKISGSMYLKGCTRTEVRRNKIVSNLEITASDDNIIEENDIKKTLYLKECTRTTLRNNNMSNFGMEGSKLSHFMNDIDTSNIADGKPIYILINQTNFEINPSTFPEIGYLGIVNSENITLRRLRIANKIQGLTLAQSTNCNIFEAVLSDNTFGLYLWNCSDNAIMGCTLIKASVRMDLCRDNIFRGNTFQRSPLQLTNSINNTFHRNNFIDCGIAGTVEDNAWDDRYSFPGPFDCPICKKKRIVGNYWSDYRGEDNGVQTQQHNCAGDGIGDTELPAHGVDYYPLMKPWVPVFGDLNYDGIVDIFDIVIVAINFTETSP